jgi:3-dehydroquinate synthetase
MNRFFSFQNTVERKSTINIRKNEKAGDIFRYIENIPDAFIIVDTGFKFVWAENFGCSEILRSAYPVAGGERCKSIDRVFELINAIHSVRVRPRKIVAIGGGALIDLCGYVARTSIPDASFEIIPTTPLSQLAGYYRRRFYLNFDRKKDRISVEGIPEKNSIFPELLSTFSTDDIRESHLSAYSVALGFDSRFYHIVKKSLSELVKDRINWDHYAELIWESNFLRARAVRRKISIFPGETFASFIQNATGLKTDYLSALSTGIRIELFIAYRMGNISEAQYTLIEEELQKLTISKRSEFDFHTLLMSLRDEKNISLPIIKHFGSSEMTKLPSEYVEKLLIAFFSIH